MADSIGSLFGDSADEFQLQENIKLHENGSSPTVVQHHHGNEDDDDIGRFEPVLELEADEAFLPVPVASMNSFDPTSMVSVHLTPKNVPEPRKAEMDTHKSEKKENADVGTSQLSRALEIFWALAIDEKSSCTSHKDEKKRRKTGD